MGIMGTVWPTLMSKCYPIGNVPGAPFADRRPVTFLFMAARQAEITGVHDAANGVIERVAINDGLAFDAGPIGEGRWHNDADALVLSPGDVLSVDVSNSDGTPPLGFFLESTDVQ